MDGRWEGGREEESKGIKRLTERGSKKGKKEELERRI